MSQKYREKLGQFKSRRQINELIDSSEMESLFTLSFFEEEDSVEPLLLSPRQTKIFPSFESTDRDYHGVTEDEY